MSQDNTRPPPILRLPPPSTHSPQAPACTTSSGAAGRSMSPRGASSCSATATTARNGISRCWRGLQGVEGESSSWTNVTSVLHLTARGGLADPVAALLQQGMACDDQGPRMRDYRPLAVRRRVRGQLGRHSASRRAAAVPDQTNAPAREKPPQHEPPRPRPSDAATLPAERPHAPHLRVLHQAAQRMQQVLLQFVKTDELLVPTAFILSGYGNPPKNLCLSTLRRADAMAHCNPLYADPATDPNRQTVIMLA
ncbi:hypothetical protein PG985_004637 [Apiospora marii]|uniref:uncharacterized protein n=1 Tax=Apiospora marii TaxID=335849 RepID=UPI00312D0279